MRVEKYFSYSHLPPFLQDVSKPFADCVKVIQEDTSDNALLAIESLNKIIISLSVFDADEIIEALRKITQTSNWIYINATLGRNYKQLAIRYLLEAKDCVLRAALPD
jgi:hypothetical protein